jgi:hypothetical protein
LLKLGAFLPFISMASVGLDTGGSQFYLSLSPAPYMNGRCVVFGRLDPKCEPVVAAIEKVRARSYSVVLPGYTKDLTRAVCLPPRAAGVHLPRPAVHGRDHRRVRRHIGVLAPG